MLVKCGVSPQAIAGIPIAVGSGHCDSFADRAPVDFICRCPAIKWIPESSYSRDAAAPTHVLNSMAGKTAIGVNMDEWRARGQHNVVAS